LTARLGQDRTAAFPHTCLIVDRGARVVVVETTASQGVAHRSLINAATELFIQEGARVVYVHVQQAEEPVISLVTQRAHVARGATLTMLSVFLGGQTTKAFVETVMEGEGGTANLLGLVLGHRGQQFDLHTLQDHHAMRTTSDLLHKVVLAGRARSLYTGLIHIRKPAQKSNAYQANKNLLLTNTAKADSIPNLEIEADDVRCTHGASVGHVDEETEFYLMSRGLPQREADRLIIHGFFEQVLGRLGQPGIQEEILESIDRKIESTL